MSGRGLQSRNTVQNIHTSSVSVSVSVSSTNQVQDETEDSPQMNDNSHISTPPSSPSPVTSSILNSTNNFENVEEKKEVVLQEESNVSKVEVVETQSILSVSNAQLQNNPIAKSTLLSTKSSHSNTNPPQRRLSRIGVTNSVIKNLGIEQLDDITLEGFILFYCCSFYDHYYHNLYS